MPSNHRCITPCQAHPITQRGTNRQRIFFIASGCSTCRRLMAQDLEVAGVRVPTSCVKANHLRFVAVTVWDRPPGLSCSSPRRRNHLNAPEAKTPPKSEIQPKWQSRLPPWPNSPTRRSITPHRRHLLRASTGNSKIHPFRPPLPRPVTED
jgi:hypothetical protein